MRGISITTRQRSRCLGVMVWRALTTHSTLRSPGRKITSLSFVAFERSTKPDSDSPGNRSKQSVRTQMLTRHTVQYQSNIQGFEGVRTPFHRCRCQQKIALVTVRQGELPEVNTAREGRQSTDKRFHSDSPQMKLEGPSKHGWG